MSIPAIEKQKQTRIVKANLGKRTWAIFELFLRLKHFSIERCQLTNWQGLCLSEERETRTEEPGTGTWTASSAKPKAYKSSVKIRKLVPEPKPTQDQVSREYWLKLAESHLKTSFFQMKLEELEGVYKVIIKKSARACLRWTGFLAIMESTNNLVELLIEVSN